MKKQLEGAAGLVKEYEESKKNTQREIEILQMRSEQMLAEKNKLNKFTTKLQSEVRNVMVSPTNVKFDNNSGRLRNTTQFRRRNYYKYYFNIFGLL